MFGLTPFNRNEISRNNRSDYLDLFNLMDDFFSNSLPSSRLLKNDTFKIDVRDEDNSYVVEAELPGFTKEEINLDINEDYLSISASKTEKKDETNQRYIHRERKATSVKRSIYLKDISPDDINAKFENGLLIVNIPKYVNETKNRSIKID